MRTLADHGVDLRQIVHPEPAADSLYCRTNAAPDWRPVEGRRHAERLIGQLGGDSPWVVLATTSSTAAPHTYFQVLGTPAGLIAEGGGFSASNSYWNWRASALGTRATPDNVGPAWYRAHHATSAEVLTVYDALAILWPALGDRDARLLIDQPVPGIRFSWIEPTPNSVGG